MRLEAWNGGFMGKQGERETEMVLCTVYCVPMTDDIIMTQLLLLTGDDVRDYIIIIMTSSWNKIYEGMFNGSLYGAGAVTIAVWAYVLAKMRPSREDGKFYVELHSRQVADCLGEEEGVVSEAISRLSSPDDESRSKQCDGARIRKCGQFAYEVINAVEYQAIRTLESRRAQWRASQNKYRQKIKSTPMTGEALALATSDSDAAEAIVAERAPSRTWPETGKTVVTPDEKEPAWMTMAKNEEQQARVIRAGDAKEDEDVPF
jgi:hypothetical protein